MTHDPDEDESTHTTSRRYKYTNDVIAGVLVAFAIGLTAAFVYRGDPVPMWLAAVDALAVLTAVVWAFGKGAFSAAADALSKT